MDQTEEPHKTHQQHPEEVEHHENSASKMFRKVKAKAKKIKNSLTNKHDESHEHDLDTEEDDELEPSPGGAIGKPESLNRPRETNVPAPEEVIPPGTKVFPVVSSDHSKPIEPVSLQDKEEGRDVATHHPLSEFSDREASREAHHQSLNTPVSLFSGTEDKDHLGGQRKVNVETPVKTEDDSIVPVGGLDYLGNSKKKGSGETGVPEITESVGLMKVENESFDRKDEQFERDLSTRNKEFKKFDEDFDSVHGKDTPAEFAGESGAGQEKDFPMKSHTEYGMEKKSPAGFGGESGAEMEKDWSTRSHDFDMKTESGLDRNSPSRSHEFDLKTEFGSDKKSPIGFERESGAELGKDQKIESGRKDDSRETDGGLGAPFGGNFPVSRDLKNESGMYKESPMGFEGEPDFLEKGRPGYGDQSEDRNFPAINDDVKAETELGKHLPTGRSEFDQKNESGKNDYSPETDTGLGAPFGGNFPVRSHELDHKNESGIEKNSPTGFDGEPDFLAKGRPGYGELSEERNLPVMSDDVKVETELGRDLPTGTHDQFSPELSHPKKKDEFVESRDDFEVKDETTQEPKPSSYTEKFASMLGYSGESHVGDQTQVAATVDEKLIPIKEKDQETESTKLPLSGVEKREQEEEKGVLGKDYVAEKLTPGEEDKALSEVITEKLKIGGGEEKEKEKEATTKKEVMVEKIPTEEKLKIGGGEEKEKEVTTPKEVKVEKIPTEESDHSEAVDEEAKGGGGMVGMIKGWFGGGGPTEEVKPKSPHSGEETSQSLDPTVVATKGSSAT